MGIGGAFSGITRRLWSESQAKCHSCVRQKRDNNILELAKCQREGATSVNSRRQESSPGGGCREWWSNPECCLPFGAGRNPTTDSPVGSAIGAGLPCICDSIRPRPESLVPPGFPRGAKTRHTSTKCFVLLPHKQNGSAARDGISAERAAELHNYAQRAIKVRAYRLTVKRRQV
jgi:hypothetical protein